MIEYYIVVKKNATDLFIRMYITFQDMQVKRQGIEYCL